MIFKFFVEEKSKFISNGTYSRNVIDVDWGLVVKLALPEKVTRRVYKIGVPVWYL
jgi:hypothetical protein